MTTTELPRPQAPWVDSPFFERELAERGLEGEAAERARRYREDGFLILEGFFPEALLDRVVAEMTPLFDPSVDDGPRSRRRVLDGFRESAAIRELAADPRLHALLAELYGREPFPFQTLNFQYGSEQRAHQDQAFFDSYPSGYMCGVWVALEEITPDNGPLFYYPGSHRLRPPTYDDLALGYRNPVSPRGFDYDAARLPHERYLAALLEATGYRRVEMSAPRGTVLVWAAGLAHGGSPIRRAGATRRSQVTHYFFRGTSFVTPIYSNPFAGDLYLRRVVDAGSGEVVPNRYYDLEISGVAENGLYHLLWELDADGGDRLRAVPHSQIVDLSKLERSLSYRIGRALTAPARLLRRG